jgi:UDP-N-acetyl-2-amino-2-deoxyglucuronate dehydrogenase
LKLDGGGALINQAVHTLDLMLWMFGEVKSVQAMSRTALHVMEAEDTLTALLEFASWALGVLQATTSLFPGYPRRLELTGSEGTLIEDYLDAIRTHREPRCNGPEGRRSLALVQAIYRASRTGERVKIERTDH